MVRIDAEMIDMGWAVCDRDAWEWINARLSTAAALERCATWGDVRTLDLPDDLVELVGESASAPEKWPDRWPDEAESFHFRLLGREGFDRTELLGGACLDFVLAHSDGPLSQFFDRHFVCIDQVGRQVAFLSNDELTAVIEFANAHSWDLRIHSHE